MSSRAVDRSDSSTLSSGGGFSAIVNDYALQIKIGIVVITTLALFFNDLVNVASQAIATDFYNYVLLIPFMMAYLVYRKRKLLSAVLPLKDDRGRGYVNLVGGMCGMFAGLLVYLYGAPSFTTDSLSFHLIALEIFLASSILLLFNRATLKILIVPVLFINAALPAAVNFGISYWYGISLYSAYPAYLFLKSLGMNITYVFNLDAPTLQLVSPNGCQGGCQFSVGVASSGVYSFVGFTIFALFVAYIAKGAIWKKVLLFFIGFVLLIPINTLREVILISAADVWGLGAFALFHLTSGIVLIFIVTFVLLLIGDRFFHLDFFRFSSRPRAACNYCSQSTAQKNMSSFCLNCGRFLKSRRSSFYSHDAIAIEAIIVLFLIFFLSLAPAVNAKTPVSFNISSNVSQEDALKLLPNVTGYNLTFIGNDHSVQEQLDADAVLDYIYSSGATQIEASVQVLTASHTPETSIVQEPINTNLQTDPVYSNTNVLVPLNQSITPLTGSFITFYNPNINANESILWWNLQAYFNFGTYNAVRTVQVQLIVYGFNATSSKISSIEQLLLPISSRIASQWDPETTFTVIQLALKQSSLPLAAAVMLPAIVLLGNDQMKRSKLKTLGSTRMAKIRDGEQRKMLEALNALKSRVFPYRIGQGTLEEILGSYSARNEGRELDPLQASIAMTYLEHLDLAEKRVITVDDEPLQVWQSLCIS